MKKFVTRFLAFCMIAGFIATIGIDDAAAQVRNQSGDTINRSFGLAAYMQFSHLEFLVPIWVSPKLVVVPVIGAKNTENFGTQTRLGAILRIYQRMARLAPYFGVRALADMFKPNGGSMVTNIEAGVLYGGEFFINNHFSFGVEAHVIVYIPDVGPRMVSTQTLMLANIYF